MRANVDTWDSIWKERENTLLDWDYLSEVVFQVLQEEIGDFNGKCILEAGSGSGRISLEVAKRKAKTALIDYSHVALGLSRKLFHKNSLDAFFIQADINNMPIRYEAYDVIWNGGVLEHYKPHQQALILRNLLNVAKKNGVVIAITPYAKSIVYNLGKKVLSAFNRWPFGKEYPLTSAHQLLSEDHKNINVKEYSIGFLVSFVDVYKFLPEKMQKNKMLKRVSNFFIKNAFKLRALDKKLSSILGGYLLVSVISKTEK